MTPVRTPDVAASVDIRNTSRFLFLVCPHKETIHCKFILSIPTEGHPDITGVTGDLVGTKACQATEEKTSSKGGDTAWKRQHSAGQHMHLLTSK